MTFGSFAQDTREVLTSSGLDNPTIFHFSYSTGPPSAAPIPPVCAHLSSLPMSLTLPQQLRGCLFSHSLSYSCSVPVYIDGFKSEDGVWCAEIFHHTTFLGSLPTFASIYTIELFVIYLALQCIIDLSESSFTIFSGSRSPSP